MNQVYERNIMSSKCKQTIKLTIKLARMGRVEMKAKSVVFASFRDGFVFNRSAIQRRPPSMINTENNSNQFYCAIGIFIASDFINFFVLTP